MATGGSGSDVGADDSENKLLCAICLEKYRRPKLLPCFHTFCQSCLQGMVGSSPSLACPSCRTVVVLPPGGVRDLQTNFYIEEDLKHTTSIPQRRLCDICTEDREATHTCIQCQQRLCLPCRRSHDAFKMSRGHTVVSLAKGDEEECAKGGSVLVRVDNQSQVEMCPKHPSQQLLLHCEQCQADICIQCKLTQHDGHPTQDLADTRAKAKTNLQDMLGNVTQQRQQINHLILALNDRRAKIEHQRQDTEQDLRGRADTLQQWVNQSLDEAATSVQTTARELDRCLQDQVEQLQNKDTALQAQQEYVMRALKDGREADAVTLEAQLNSSLLETAGMKLIEKEMTKDIPKLHVKHSSSAISLLQLREFVGVLQPIQQTSCPLQPPLTSSRAPTRPMSPPVNTSVISGKTKSPRNVSYSQNRSASVVAMCPISQNRLWVMYRPSKDAAVLMKLFDADGQVLTTVNSAKACSGLVAITKDTILSWCSGSWKVQMINADGGVSDHDLRIAIGHLIPSAKNDIQYVRDMTSKLYRISFSTAGQLTYSILSTVCRLAPLSNCPGHVSSNGEYVVFVTDGKVLVYRNTSDLSAGLFASYFQNEKKSVDARFCRFDGQELLLVACQPDDIFDNEIDIIDHTDGCRFVKPCEWVSPNSPFDFYRPQCLATNFDQRVWIGCDGGRIAMIDL